jgi:periplasmic protein TonB
MRPRRSLVAWILVAGAVHALLLLLPRPGGQGTEPIPTIELTLADMGTGPAAVMSRGPEPGPSVVGSAAASEPAPAAAAVPAVPAVEPLAPGLSPPAEETKIEPAPQAAEPGAASVPDPAAASRAQPVGGGTPGAGGAISAAVGSAGSAGGGGAGSPDPAGSALTPPRPRTQISPAYPRAARAAGAQGVVRITALIDAAGAVVSADISVSSGTASLDRAALEEVRRTVFQPAVQRGKTVPCRLIIPVRFTLN